MLPREEFEGKEWRWDGKSCQGILCGFLGRVGKLSIRAAWLGSHPGLGGALLCLWGKWGE